MDKNSQNLPFYYTSLSKDSRSNSRLILEEKADQLTNIKRITLEPGESTLVSFQLTPEAIEMVKNDGSRVIESGDFKIYVGGSSPMKRSFELGALKMAETVITIE